MADVQPRVERLRQAAAVAYLASLFVTDLAWPQARLGRLAGLLPLYMLPFVLLAHAADAPWFRRAMRGRVVLFSLATAAFLAWGILVTLVHAWGAPSLVLGEPVGLKAAKVVLLLSTWLGAILAGALLLARRDRIVQRALVTLTVAAVALAIAERAGLLDWMSGVGWFHPGPNIQMRPRLFTLEASVAASLVAALALLACVGASRRARLALLAIGTLGLVVIGSKGALACWGLALIAFALPALRPRSWSRRGVMAALALVLAAIAMMGLALHAVQSDLKQSTSSSTRLAYFFSGGQAVATHPEGAGFGTFPLSAQQWLAQGQALGARLLGGHPNPELTGLLTQESAKNLFPKDLLTSLAWVGGVPGVLLWCTLVLLLLPNLRAHDPARRAGAAFFLLATLGFLTSLYEPHLTLLAGALLVGPRETPAAAEADASRRLLVVLPDLPFPVRYGGQAEVGRFLHAAARNGYTLDLLVTSRDEPSTEALEALRPIARRVWVVRRRRGPWQALHPAHTFQRQSRRVPRRVLREATAALRREGGTIVCQSLYTGHIGLALARASRRPLVVRSHNAEADYFRRLAASERRPLRRLFYAFDALRMEALEDEVLADSQTVRVADLSVEDHRTHKALYGERCVLAPPMRDPLPAAQGDAEGGFATRRDEVLFVGSLFMPNNIDAVLRFHAEVWPDVRSRVPGARLVLVGSRPDPRVLALRSDPSVEVVADAPDLSPHYTKARVFVNPDLQGSGVNMKNIEALSQGLPIVSTPSGARGLSWQPGEGFLLGATPAAMAEAVALLLQDGARWGEVREAGMRFVREALDPDRSLAAILGHPELRKASTDAALEAA